jgi:hypothetical protein
MTDMRQRIKRESALAALTILALAAARPAAAQEMIRNSGFETGDFTNWTDTHTPGALELTPWKVARAGAGYFSDSDPLSGGSDALNGFDGQQYELYQTVTSMPTDKSRSPPQTESSTRV